MASNLYPKMTCRKLQLINGIRQFGHPVSSAFLTAPYIMYLLLPQSSAFKDHEVTFMASNNIKSIGKSIGVKVSPILFLKVSVLVSAILSAHSIGIVIGNTFCKYR